MNDSIPGNTSDVPSPIAHQPPLPLSGGQVLPTEQAGDTSAGPAAKAASVVGQIKDQVATTFSDRKAGIADRIKEVADAAHRSGEHFAGKQDWIADAIERGASELTTLAGSLRETDAGTIVQQVQSFARRRPALFAGGCLAAGFALARIGKIVAANVSRDDLPTMPEVAHGQH